MITVLFFLFAVIAIAAAIMMIVHRNPIYSALFLILTLFMLAGLFVLLNAPFIAAVHIIIYAGAIMVLFLFVIMLLGLTSDKTKERTSKLLLFSGIFITGILLIELGFILISDNAIFTQEASVLKSSVQIGDTRSIGELLFTKYLFPFEVTSVLLLTAIIGSVILAKKS